MTSSDDPVKIILVTGGVISGVGKGIVSSSLGVLLKANGYRVTAIKIDPYINLDAGTFSPWEHGEVFVLDDGGEVDLDLGNYERFLNVCLTKDNNITTGKIYNKVIKEERAGNYLGKTVQIVPHITDAIRQWVLEVAQRPVDKTGETPHVCIVELGGTVGDMESAPYMYAMSQLTTDEWKGRFFHVHVSMLIDMESELKTKPLQNSIAEVNAKGLKPDMIACRSFNEISDQLKEKISSCCAISKSKVIGIHNLPNIYQVPLLMMSQGVLSLIEKKLELKRVEPIKALQNCPNLEQWTKLSELVEKYTEVVKIALVGKYFALDHTTGEAKVRIFTDAYSSVIKALKHAATHSERKLEILFVIADHLEDDAPADKRQAAWNLVKQAQGILVPGGFGYRGIEGKILACKYARENNIPFLGICLGMQCAAIEFARNVCNIPNANSTEFAKERGFILKEEEQVVIDMPEHHGGDMGGTMRLGRRATVFLTKDCKLYKLYGENNAIEERHRHRYEVNPKIVPKLNSAGLHFVGMGLDETSPGNQTSTATGRTLLKLACQQNYEGLESFKKKVNDLCEKGTTTNTAVRMEMVELKDHDYFVGVQYHPEYTSHPLAPSPPFRGLLLAASGQLQGYLEGTRMPSPVDLFKNVGNVAESKFNFLPSAGNSSASLLANFNEETNNFKSNELKVPGKAPVVPSECPQIDENSTPVFTPAVSRKRDPSLTIPLGENSIIEK